MTHNDLAMSGRHKVRNIVVFGATSLIAQQTCRAYLTHSSCGFVLIGRDAARVQLCADNLLACGAQYCHVITADLAKVEAHMSIIDEVVRKVERIDVALIAYGVLYKIEETMTDVDLAAIELQANFTSQVLLLNRLSVRFIQQKSGSIVVLSSVAGDRGRKSNFNYGSSKAGLSSFCEGLRGRLMPYGVAVLTVKPGMVDTPMSRSFHKGGLLVASADRVGHQIARMTERGAGVYYTPWFWRWIMLVIRILPVRMIDRFNL